MRTNDHFFLCFLFSIFFVKWSVFVLVQGASTFPELGIAHTRQRQLAIAVRRGGSSLHWWPYLDAAGFTGNAQLHPSQLPPLLATK